MRIFVSYTTRDSYVNSNYLKSLVDQLILFGDPYIDLLHNDSEEKQKKVENELNNSDLILLLSSESTQHSNWVNWELRQAKKIKIPVCKIKICKEIHINTVRNLINQKLHQHQELLMNKIRL